jgi:NTP pyrophosphatase (non-canonical NTP hydrolase)
VRTRLRERYGQACRVLARGRLNTCVVEFEDGYRAATSRNYVRRRKMEKNIAYLRECFLTGWSEISSQIHQNAINKGFWDMGVINRNQAEMIALMHSELSEALEAIRHGNPESDHISNFSGLEEELADLVIRIMDMGEAYKLRLAEAILVKMQFNSGREYKHGKNF